MSEFARQVVREEVALPPLVPTVVHKKRRERLVGAILGSRVYCHFEQPGAGNRLRCAFSNERKYLLGETVRDWLGEEENARDFLWCEALDGDLAYVLVAGGAVVKDVPEAKNPRREMAAVLARLDSQAPVFAHPSVEVEAVTTYPRARRLETSVRDRLARQQARGAAVAELGLVNEIPAVRLWNSCWKWMRTVVLGGVAVTAVALAYFYLRGDEPAAAQAVQETRERILTDYDRLLLAADARTVLGGVHRAYRQFLGDPFFGGRWRVSSMAWRRIEGNTLKVVAELPHSPPEKGQAPPSAEDDVQFGVPWEELAALQRSVYTYAQRREWTVEEVDRLRVIVRLPVAAAARTRAEGAKRRQAPQNEGDRWHWRSMRRDLEAFGALRPVPEERRTAAPQNNAPPALFQADQYRLDLRGLEWAYPDAAHWLGDRLSGGPVVLDEVHLERASGDDRSWQGRILFRTVWCKNYGCTVVRDDGSRHPG